MKLVKLFADDVVKASLLWEWIERQCRQIMTSNSSYGSNVISPHITEIEHQCGTSRYWQWHCEGSKMCEEKGRT